MNIFLDWNIIVTLGIDFFTFTSKRLLDHFSNHKEWTSLLRLKDLTFIFNKLCDNICIFKY